jgi:hypothetical protein
MRRQGPEVFVSVTRLRLRSARFLLPFLWYTWRSLRQARRSSGCRAAETRKSRGLTFWTLRVWETEAAMSAFRGTSPHREAMTRLPAWCDEASVAHWTEASGDVPPWERAAGQLAARGRLSRVQHPSSDQAAGHIVVD